MFCPPTNKFLNFFIIVLTFDFRLVIQVFLDLKKDKRFRSSTLVEIRFLV